MIVTPYYVSTTIPYVNGRPHMGHALEFVQVDTLARHQRQRGRAVVAVSGTDDHAAKNAQTAAALGRDTQELVDTNAELFQRLLGRLQCRFDQYVRTSHDPRHRPAVHRLWTACAHAGDLYRTSYTGDYCTGCETFYQPDELVEGRCAEHDREPERVEETNWFFRLSRYQDQLLDVLSSGRLQIVPRHRHNEVVAFVASGLADISVSRDAARTRGWGLQVPGDPHQTIYVWFDALVNYLTALDWGHDDPAVSHVWDQGQVIHVVGKGVVRFHAVFWPAFLLAAGVTLPDRIFVHEYITAGGVKLSKTTGVVIDPADVLDRHGVDAVRWWLLREVNRTVDTDLTDQRIIDRYDRDLANGVGNLVNRTVTMIGRYCADQLPSVLEAAERARRSHHQRDGSVAAAIDRALDRFDLQAATDQIVRLVDDANATIQQTRPWELARLDNHHERLHPVLGDLLARCRTIGVHLQPFLPQAADRIQQQCAPPELTSPRPVFPRLG